MTRRTRETGLKRASGSRETSLVPASSLALVAMTTSAGSGEATLALIGREEEHGGDSDDRGRSGHRYSRQQGAEHRSVHRVFVQTGRCTTDFDEVTKDLLDLVNVLDNGESLQLGRA